MAAAAAATPVPITVDSGLAELQRQQDLISSCTALWQDLSAHFSTLDRRIADRSADLRRQHDSLDLQVQSTLDSLSRRRASIDPAVSLAVSRLHHPRAPSSPAATLAHKLHSLASTMQCEPFFSTVVSKRKEIDVLRAELPSALLGCIDPPRFVLDAIGKVFPVDKREGPGPDVGWALVLILESAVPAVEDPEMGVARPLVPRAAKERARGMAEAWKEAEKTGAEVRPAEVHAFLQFVVTFGVVDKGDRELYRKLVMSIAWRKQMPRIAVQLGLEDMLTDMIEELIGKGQQLDAINFAYEAGLVDKFPPVPLLKSFLEDAKKATALNLEDQNNSGLSVFNASRKEQSVIRAAMKCIEDRKLETEFHLEEPQKRLEHLEKAKVEKKKSPSLAGPANKRTRTNNGSPMPPAKAGRLTNHAYVSSFPAPIATTFARSPSSHPTYPAVASLYPYDRATGHGVYGSRSPPALRDPYAYPTEVVSPVLGSPYSPTPMNYPPYGGYNNGMVGGYNNLSPGYQPAYYR